MGEQGERARRDGANARGGSGRRDEIKDEEGRIKGGKAFARERGEMKNG